MSQQAVYELVGGPQDGAKVREVGGQIPRLIFLGPSWLGDGYAAWSESGSSRFPCRYCERDGKYHFAGWW